LLIQLFFVCVCVCVLRGWVPRGPCKSYVVNSPRRSYSLFHIYTYVLLVLYIYILSKYLLSHTAQ
jgi:hypothetical protein